MSLILGLTVKLKVDKSKDAGGKRDTECTTCKSAERRTSSETAEMIFYAIMQSYFCQDKFSELMCREMFLYVDITAVCFLEQSSSTKPGLQLHADSTGPYSQGSTVGHLSCVC